MDADVAIGLAVIVLAVIGLAAIVLPTAAAAVGVAISFFIVQRAVFFVLVIITIIAINALSLSLFVCHRLLQRDKRRRLYLGAYG